MQIFTFLSFNRKIYYWVIGGSVAEWISTGKVNKRYYRVIKTFIVEGDRMRKDLLNSGFENVVVVPNVKPITYIPAKHNIKHDVLKFVFLSRITSTKGCDYIIEAARRLNSSNYFERFYVDFYGKIDELYEDEFLCKIKILNNVNYKGFLDLRVESNYDVLGQYDAMLFPTYWHGERFPNVVCEAMGCGLPNCLQ